jgi:hypothetical protein
MIARVPQLILPDAKWQESDALALLLPPEGRGLVGRISVRMLEVSGSNLGAQTTCFVVALRISIHAGMLP